MIAKELTSIQTKCYQYAKGQCIMRAIQCISRSRRLPEHGWLIKPGTEFHCLRYIHWLKKLRIELNNLPRSNGPNWLSYNPAYHRPNYQHWLQLSL